MNIVADGYIKNKHKLERTICIYSVIFWFVNLLFLELSINMLFKIIIASTTDWFDDIVEKGLVNDPYFATRTKMIVLTIIAIIVVVIVFSVVTMILFRNMQLKNILTQIGVLTTIGYNKMKVCQFIMRESYWDIMMTFPISIVVSMIIWKFVGTVEIVSSLQDLVGNIVVIDISTYLLCGLIMIEIVIIHTKVFVKTSMKKGIRYMLGKGIV